jgi:hypothetical protein
MRVELSPWKFTQTSLEPSKRRRDRSDTCSPLNDESCFVSSFIDQTSSSLRSRRKRTCKRGPSGKLTTSTDAYEDRLPVLLVTTSHRIAVLVESDASIKELSSTASDQLVESDVLQFSSRPGKSTAFLPGSKAVKRNGTSKKAANEQACPIPAVFDAIQSRVYALQDNNKRLVCFSASPGSISDSTQTVSASLECAALDLSVFHLPRTGNIPSRCVVYGTCQDARIFVACIVERDNGHFFSIQHVGFDEPPGSSICDAQHIGTLAHLRTLDTTVRTSDLIVRKRSLNTETDMEWPVVVFDQLFRDDTNVVLRRQAVMAAYPAGLKESVAANGDISWVTAIADTQSRRLSSVSLIPHNSPAHGTISRATTLGFVDGSEAASIFYTITPSMPNHSMQSNGKAAGKHESSFFASISLRSPRIVSGPVPLPFQTRQIGLVGPALLAVMTSENEISLFDTMRGSKIFSCQPLASLSDTGLQCTLVTDSKRSRLAIGFEKGGKYTIGFASARAESSASMQSVLSGTTGKLSLAASLASSMRTEPIPVVARSFDLTRHLGTQEYCDEHHHVVKGKASRVASRSILDSRVSPSLTYPRRNRNA